jgi:hypothetical protein
VGGLRAGRGYSPVRERRIASSTTWPLPTLGRPREVAAPQEAPLEGGHHRGREIGRGGVRCKASDDVAERRGFGSRRRDVQNPGRRASMVLAEHGAPPMTDHGDFLCNTF